MTSKFPVMKYGMDQAWTSARMERHNNDIAGVKVST